MQWKITSLIQVLFEPEEGKLLSILISCPSLKYPGIILLLTQILGGKKKTNNKLGICQNILI